MKFLLGPGDPAPVDVIPGHDPAWLVVCDHASRAIPASLGDLGVSPEDLRDHIAWDIGALDISRRLAGRLGSPMVACGYSRLVIDCNRYPARLDAMPELSDGRRVPANAGLNDGDRALRIESIFRPYQQAISGEIEKALATGVCPVLISIHSCTPRMGGIDRPWEIGIGWTRDERVSRPVIDALIRAGDMVVGDNLPYGLDLGIDFTTPEQAMARGLGHLQVEFRQDLIGDRVSAEAWADKLFDALAGAEDKTSWHEQQFHLTVEDGVLGADRSIPAFLFT